MNINDRMKGLSKKKFKLISIDLVLLQLITPIFTVLIYSFRWSNATHHLARLIKT